MKQLGRFDGLFYTFARVNDLRAATLGRRLMREIAAFDAEAVRRAMVGADRMVAPLMGTLEAGAARGKALLQAGAVAGAGAGRRPDGAAPRTPSTRPGRWPRGCARRCSTKTRPPRKAPGTPRPWPAWASAAPFPASRAPFANAGVSTRSGVAPLCSVPTATAAALGLACAAEL